MMWKFAKTGIDGNCELFGVNIFKYRWQDTGNKASVHDPYYGREFQMTIYTADIGSEVVTFAAGEFSNCVYGFYIKED